MANHLIRAKIEDEEIVIRVKIKDLVFIVENDPEYKYKVLNENKFAKEVVFEINDGTSLCNIHTGVRDIENLFQRAYESVSENGDDDVMTSEEHSN